MTDKTVDMDLRRQLADRVEPDLPKRERETGIDWFQTDDRATVTSYSPSVVRSLLCHAEARVCWIYATDSSEVSGRVQDLSKLRGVSASVEGVQVTVPVGTLGIKGVTRSSNRDSDIVKTPEEAAEAFADGGYSVPSVGSTVQDRDDGDELIVVDTHPEQRAGDHVLESVGGLTVAELNPEYDASAPVVEAVYQTEIRSTLDNWRSVEDLRDAVEFDAIEAYSFPADRLTTVYGGVEA